MSSIASNSSPYLLEVCANSYRSALAAELGGAKRVELCDNLAEGGTTPSYAQISISVKNLTIEVWPIIRPRGGDFLYNDIEFDIMLEDIDSCKSIGCVGIVIGILTSDGQIDKERMKEVIAAAKPMPVAFHRAFDMCRDKEKALEELIQMGVVRVLSSGGASSALNGSEALEKLVTQAGDRITIMPGAGISEKNIKQLISKTKATEFHASAKAPVKSEMKFRNTAAKMGTATDEYQYELTLESRVKAIVAEFSN